MHTHIRSALPALQPRRAPRVLFARVSQAAQHDLLQGAHRGCGGGQDSGGSWGWMPEAGGGVYVCVTVQDMRQCPGA